MGRKYKGQSTKTAMMLFGLKGGRKMESPEDRLALCNALSASTDVRFRTLAAEAIHIHKSSSIASIAEQHGMTWEDLGKEYTRILKVEGMMRQARHLPDLLEQIAVDSRNTTGPCLDCEGTGRVPGKPAYKIGAREGDSRGDRMCKTCRGEGKVTLYGDLEKLKLVLETHQLIGKAAGGGVNLNLDLRKVDQPEQLETLASSVAGIVNGEVVKKDITQ